MIEEETPLFRIISLETLLQILLYSEERYVKPMTWDDTFEGCGLRYVNDKERFPGLIESLYLTTDKDKNLYDNLLFKFVKAETIVNYSYGQCWSLNDNSDAMWRIYDYGNKSIQIESDKKRITESIVHKSDDYEYRIKVDSVKYDITKNDAAEAFVKHFKKRISLVEQFFHKREAFEHEKEVRIIYIDSKADVAFRNRLNRLRRILINELSIKGIVDYNEFICNIINQDTIGVLGTEDSISLPITSISTYIKCIRVHPLAEEWYVKLIEKLCNANGIVFGGKSDLYEKI